MRAKIYSLLSKLGFERVSDTLSIREKQKLALISKYLDFKIGEVWTEIGEELKYQGIRPISPDLDCIKAVEDCILKKAEHVYKKQVELDRKQGEVLVLM